MNKKAQYEALISLIIIISSIIALLIGFKFLFGTTISPLTGHVTMEFPNSSSKVLSGIERTYKANEKIIVKIKITNETINFVKINEKYPEYNYEDNQTIFLILDTSINTKESRETNIIRINGLSIDGTNFTQIENYEVVMSTEEFALEKAKNAEFLSKQSNTIAILAIIFSILSFIISIVEIYYLRKKRSF